MSDLHGRLFALAAKHGIPAEAEADLVQIIGDAQTSEVRLIVEGLVERLTRANGPLEQMARDHESEGVHREAERLRGKAEGVRLARSYAEELLR